MLAALVGLLLSLSAVAAAVGAEPGADPLGLLEGGDPRSDGAGPGIVGSPLLLLGAVVLLGLASAAVTVLLVRLAGRR